MAIDDKTVDVNVSGLNPEQQEKKINDAITKSVQDRVNRAIREKGAIKLNPSAVALNKLRNVNNFSKAGLEPKKTAIPNHMISPNNDSRKALAPDTASDNKSVNQVENVDGNHPSMTTVSDTTTRSGNNYSNRQYNDNPAVRRNNARDNNQEVVIRRPATVGTSGLPHNNLVQNNYNKFKNSNPRPQPSNNSEEGTLPVETPEKEEIPVPKENPLQLDIPDQDEVLDEIDDEDVEEENTLFKVVYDLNGGKTYDGSSSIETYQEPYILVISTAYFIDDVGVRPPENVKLVAIEINGKRYNVDENLSYELNQDTTYRYVWRAIQNEEEAIEEEEEIIEEESPDESDIVVEDEEQSEEVDGEAQDGQPVSEGAGPAEVGVAAAAAGVAAKRGNSGTKRDATDKKNPDGEKGPKKGSDGKGETDKPKDSPRGEGRPNRPRLGEGAGNNPKPVGPHNNMPNPIGSGAGKPTATSGERTRRRVSNNSGGGEVPGGKKKLGKNRIPKVKRAPRPPISNDTGGRARSGPGMGDSDKESREKGKLENAKIKRERKKKMIKLLMKFLPFILMFVGFLLIIIIIMAMLSSVVSSIIGTDELGIGDDSDFDDVRSEVEEESTTDDTAYMNSEFEKYFKV